MAMSSVRRLSGWWLSAESRRVAGTGELMIRLIPIEISGTYPRFFDNDEIFLQHEAMAHLLHILVGIPGEEIVPQASDEAFVARVEKITGRDLSNEKLGRPRKRPSYNQ
jgi:hypothetical protein